MYGHVLDICCHGYLAWLLYQHAGIVLEPETGAQLSHEDKIRLFSLFFPANMKDNRCVGCGCEWDVCLLDNDCRGSVNTEVGEGGGASVGFTL